MATKLWNFCNSFCMAYMYRDLFNKLIICGDKNKFNNVGRNSSFLTLVVVETK